MDIFDRYPAENCKDNDLRTYWQGQWGQPVMIDIDLGQMRKIDRIKIYGSGIREHNIQYKAENGQYISIHEAQYFNDPEIYVKVYNRPISTKYKILPEMPVVFWETHRPL